MKLSKEYLSAATAHAASNPKFHEAVHMAHLASLGLSDKDVKQIVDKRAPQIANEDTAKALRNLPEEQHAAHIDRLAEANQDDPNKDTEAYVSERRKKRAGESLPAKYVPGGAKGQNAGGRR